MTIIKVTQTPKIFVMLSNEQANKPKGIVINTKEYNHRLILSRPQSVKITLENRKKRLKIKILEPQLLGYYPLLLRPSQK
jgi:hypothetical protein